MTEVELVAEGLHPKDIVWLEGRIEELEAERDDYKERYNHQCELKYALQDNEAKLENERDDALEQLAYSRRQQAI